MGLTVKEVADRLGVSEQAVRLWCRTGVLPASQPTGRQWRIDPELLEAWLRRCSVGEVLESLHANYRTDHPEHDLLDESVALRRDEERGAQG